MIVLVGAAGCSNSNNASKGPFVSVATSTPVEGTATDPVLAALVKAADHGDPSEISLPEGDAATVAWLTGDGSPAVGLIGASEQLWKEGASACAAAAGQLDAVGTPAELLAAASGTPELATRDILVELHAALGRLLATCDDAQAFVTAQADFAWQWALADRRLTELGVVR